MKQIAIIGAGGFGREIKCLIDDINKIKSTYHIIGFYDDDTSLKEKYLNGLPYLGTVNDLNKVESNLCVVLGIGDPKIKKNIISNINNRNINFPNLVHPSVIISNDDVKLGKGIVICAGTIVTCNIEIQDFVTLNLMCTVGHDTTLKVYCSFMPGVNISGEVIVEEGVYVGTGAKIINQLSIGEYSIVGSGAVVSKSLQSRCTAVGIPAKPIKFH